MYWLILINIIVANHTKQQVAAYRNWTIMMHSQRMEPQHQDISKTKRGAQRDLWQKTWRLDSGFQSLGENYKIPTLALYTLPLVSGKTVLKNSIGDLGPVSPNPRFAPDPRLSTGLPVVATTKSTQCQPTCLLMSSHCKFVHTRCVGRSMVLMNPIEFK